MLLLELGLRVSEAVGADIEDLGEQGRHRVLHPKGNGQRTKASVAPLNPAVAHAVDEARAGCSQGPLLITSTGRRLTRQHAGKLIKRLGEQIGLPSLHPYALRHGFVTISLDEGASLRDVQDAARHARSSHHTPLRQEPQQPQPPPHPPATRSTRALTLQLVAEKCQPHLRATPSTVAPWLSACLQDAFGELDAACEDFQTEDQCSDHTELAEQSDRV